MPVYTPPPFEGICWDSPQKLQGPRAFLSNNKRSCHLRWWKESMCFLVRCRETGRCYRWPGSSNATQWDQLFFVRSIDGYSSCVCMCFYRICIIIIIILAIIIIILLLFVIIVILYFSFYTCANQECVYIYIGSSLCICIYTRCFRNTCWWPLKLARTDNLWQSWHERIHIWGGYDLPPRGRDTLPSQKRLDMTYLTYPRVVAMKYQCQYQWNLHVIWQRWCMKFIYPIHIRRQRPSTCLTTWSLLDDLRQAIGQCPWSNSMVPWYQLKETLGKSGWQIFRIPKTNWKSW